MLDSSKEPTPLTDAFVRNLRPSAERQEFPDPQTPGLRMRVSPAGKKSWIYEALLHNSEFGRFTT